MEKFARDIALGLKLLSLEPTETEIKKIAKKKDFHGDIFDLINRVNELWDVDYFSAYRRYYQRRHGPREAEKLEESCKDVINRIWNEEAGEFEAKTGLVLGHVQAGKTGNFIGQMALAADKGVRLFIVLTGITNLLRRQTQERIEEGFTGYSTESWERIGVGENNDFLLPYSYTDRDNDMVPDSAVHPAFLNVPGVIIVKKCIDALGHLRDWVVRQIEIYGHMDIPMMMIDDEADLASLNRNDEEEDPTPINKIIMEILGLFDNRVYLGYTATPFTNLIAGGELAPREILCCLPTPRPAYFGPQKLFLNKDIRERNIWLINDVNNDERIAWLERLPETLKQAFLTFLVARSIYAIELNPNDPCCMMVNVDPERDEQVIINARLNTYWEWWKNRLHNAAAGDEIWNRFKEIYDDDFRAIYPGLWTQIRNRIRTLAREGINFYILNSDNDNVALRKGMEKDGATSVITGGHSLSRGLTLPGLLVSYIIRPNARNAALMQMARWFGYRGRYAKLCRIWMPEIMHENYIDVTKKIVELHRVVNNLDPELPYEELEEDVLNLFEGNEEE